MKESVVHSGTNLRLVPFNIRRTSVQRFYGQDLRATIAVPTDVLTAATTVAATVGQTVGQAAGQTAGQAADMGLVAQMAVTDVDQSEWLFDRVVYSR